MHLIKCPWCGVRDETEFRYRGDATVRRPPPDGSADAFFDYLHKRANPNGWHVEWWHHIGGCRQHVKVVRHTVSHQVAWTGRADEAPRVPAGAEGGR